MTGGSIFNLNLQFNTTIDSGLTLFGGVSATTSDSVVIKSVNVSGDISIKSRAEGNVTVGGIFGTAGNVKSREREDTVRLNCTISVDAHNASVWLGGFIGTLENTEVVKQYAGEPHVKCQAKHCYVGGFTSTAAGPVENIHLTGSVVKVTALRHSVVGGIVGYGNNIQLCSSDNPTVSVTSTGRILSGASVGGVLGETNAEHYVINTTFIKASLVILEARSSSYLGGVLGYGKHMGGTIKNSYAVVQSLRGYNNGGHMYGGGFLGYANASLLNFSTCYMFVPEFQFFEKPGAGGHSYYGGFFGFINGSSSDKPLVHSLQAGMGKFEVRMVAQGTNAGNFGGAIEASKETLLERIVLMGAAGVWSGEAPENAAIFIGKLGPGISLKTILVNISIGNGNGLDNTANFVNTFTGTATDIVYNSGVARTSKFAPSTGKYDHFNIRVNSTTQESCEDYFKIFPLDKTTFNCATSDELNQTASSDSTKWKFKDMDNWAHDPKGWYLPKGVPVANSEITSPALFMTIYQNKQEDTSPSWQESGWDNKTIWRFGNTNKTDLEKAIPPSFPALWDNPEPELACPPQTCDRESFFSPFLCNCLHGCPGLKNGQCSSYNGATCDEGWKTVGTSLCTGFLCKVNNTQLCGGEQVAKCDADSGLCKCTNPQEYYNTSTKTCMMGCQGLSHGFCTGLGVAVCDKGWKNGENSLCAVYSCSSDDSGTACGGSSNAECNTQYDVCKCKDSKSAYDANTKQCVSNKCNIASGDHICIGENKAICMSHYWPSTGKSGEVLCAHYDCTRAQTCADGSFCDIDTFACKCSKPEQYFSTADSTCKDGCTGLTADAGVCTGPNQALCYKGYTTPSSGQLCSQYSCADVDPTCGGHGTCSSGTCVCNEGAMKLNNTCFASICIHGQVSSSKDSCTCEQGWSMDQAMAPLMCTTPSTCPASIDVRSGADLIYLYSCGSATYNLLADVAVSYPWLPVPSFTGTFNGNGHTIRGVQLQEKDAVAALFRTVSGGKISDLAVEFMTSISSSTVKAVAGIAPTLDDGVISNVTVLGSISVKTGIADVVVGGIASQCAGLRNATFAGQLSVEGHSTVTMGALCGVASAPLADLAASGSINCSSRSLCLVGGLVGRTVHTISSSSSSVSITASSAKGLVGGIVGGTAGNLTNLTFTGNVSLPLDGKGLVGGIAGLVKPESTGQPLTVKKCNVVSPSILSPLAGGLVGVVEAGAIEESSVTLTALEGSVCVGGLVCNATNVTITKSNSNVDKLEFAAGHAEETEKQYYGGFVANATETAIEDSYSVVAASVVGTTSEAFVGGFVGNAAGLTVGRSYTSGSLIKLTPNAILHFGGFVGSCVCSVDSSFSRIVQITLSKTKISSVHFGGFVGVIRGAFTGAGRTALSPQITNSWVSSSMYVFLSNAEASRVFYGGFSGEASSAAITDSYTRSILSVNNDINLYHTGFGAFNGRFDEEKTNIMRCYADVEVSGASDLNFEGNSAYGKKCGNCTKVLINSDKPGISDAVAYGRTTAELQKSETFVKEFGSAGAFVFEPGRMPMLAATPNLDSVTNAYVYPSCDPATQGDCWDYENTWVVSPNGIGSVATAPSCKVGNCLYCDARDPGVCKVCASRTFLNSGNTCSPCSGSCAECITRASFCTACRKSGIMPDANGVCGGGLSSGAIAGISIVIILVVGGVVGFLCWWFMCRSKTKPAKEQSCILESSFSTVNVTSMV